MKRFLKRTLNKVSQPHHYNQSNCISLQMSRTFTIRIPKYPTEKIEVESHETLNDFKSKIRATYGFESHQQMKLIVRRILTEDEFNGLQDGTTILVVLRSEITKPPVESTDTSSNVNPNENSNPNTNTNTDTNVNAEPTYDFRCIKAYTIVMLQFIVTNPQMKDMFQNDFGMLMMELMKNPQLESLMKNILRQTNSIADSMDKGENIKLDINMDDHSQQEGTCEKIELTPEDQQNIDNIINMGFDPNETVVQYLRNNKNVNLTLEALQR